MTVRFGCLAAIVTFTLSVLGLSPCTRLLAQEGASTSTSKTSPAPLKLEAYELGNTERVHRFGNIVLAGQPDQAMFAKLKQHGITTVLSLRETIELDWDEKQVAEAAGLRFVQLPIQGPDDLTPKMLEESLALMRAAKEDNGVLVHCAVAGRVGPVWMAYRVMEDNLSVEEARNEAKQVGMRASVLEAKVIEYLKAEGKE